MLVFFLSDPWYEYNWILKEEKNKIDLPLFLFNSYWQRKTEIGGFFNHPLHVHRYHLINGFCRSYFLCLWVAFCYAEEVTRKLSQTIFLQKTNTCKCCQYIIFYSLIFQSRHILIFTFSGRCELKVHDPIEFNHIMVDLKVTDGSSK